MCCVFLLCLGYSWKFLCLLIMCQPCVAPSLKVTLNSWGDPYLLVIPFIIRSTVLPSAPKHILAWLCIQLNNPEQPRASQVPGISQCFRGNLEMNTTVFLFPTSLLCLKYLLLVYEGKPQAGGLRHFCLQPVTQSPNLPLCPIKSAPDDLSPLGYSPVS